MVQPQCHNLLHNSHFQNISRRAPLEFKEEAVLRLSMRAVKDPKGKGSGVGESTHEVETSIFVGQKDIAPAVELDEQQTADSRAGGSKNRKRE